MQFTRFFADNDCKIAVYESGPSTDLSILFLHGNSAGAAMFKEQFNFSLNDKFHLVAIDLPGHGKSCGAEEPENSYNLPSIVKAVGRIIADINKPLIIAGSSFGGHIALELLDIESILIKGIFIDGTPPLTSAADLSNAFLPNPASASLFKEQNSDEELKQLTAACINNPKHYAFFEDMVKTTDPRFRSFIFKSVANNEMKDEKLIAETSSVPIAVLHGEADKIINRDYYEKIAYNSLWRSRIHLIPDAGHLPCLENPLLYNDLLTQYANEVCQKK